MKSYTKKTIKRLFSLLLTAIVACMTLGVSVFADTVDMGEDLSAQEGLYIGTKECPEGYIIYAKENVGRYLASVEPGEIPENSTLTVGNPFCFANVDADIYSTYFLKRIRVTVLPTIAQCTIGAKNEDYNKNKNSATV